MARVAFRYFGLEQKGKRIRRAVRKVVKVGGRLAHSWGVRLELGGGYVPSPRFDGTNACCPMGALLINSKAPKNGFDGNFSGDAAKVLGVSEGSVDAFIAGFDNTADQRNLGTSQEKRWWRLGREFRKFQK